MVSKLEQRANPNRKGAKLHIRPNLHLRRGEVTSPTATQRFRKCELPPSKGAANPTPTTCHQISKLEQHDKPNHRLRNLSIPRTLTLRRGEVSSPTPTQRLRTTEAPSPNGLGDPNPTKNHGNELINSPQEHRSVNTPAGKHLAIWTERYTIDLVCMPRESALRFACDDIP